MKIDRNHTHRPRQANGELRSAEERRLVDALDALTVATPESVVATERPFARLAAVWQTPNVIALGIANKRRNGRYVGPLSLVFYVRAKRPLDLLRDEERLPDRLPSEFEAGLELPTDVVELGDVTLQGGAGTRVYPGQSISSASGSAGTLGALVHTRDGIRLLSNRHVFAEPEPAAAGSAILAPGKRDGGSEPADLVARLTSWSEYVTGGQFVNRADWALATPSDDRIADLSPRINGDRPPSGVTAPRRGMRVVKFGRTTGRTESTVIDTNFRIEIKYPGIGSVGFHDLIRCDRYTAAGDSGALVMEADTMLAVGLHFAGGDKDGSIASPIIPILQDADCELITEHGE